jgi:hypothetical protein
VAKQMEKRFVEETQDELKMVSPEFVIPKKKPKE